MPRALPAADVTEGVDAAAGTSTIYTLGLRELFQGTIRSLGDTDWVRVELTAGETSVFSLWGTQGGLEDTELTLYDARGFAVASNDDVISGNAFSLITYTAPVSGTYYLQAEAWNGNETGAYRLRFSSDVFTLEEIATQLSEIDWGEPWPLAFNAGPGSTLTVNLTALTAAGQQLARWALESWSQVTGLVFVETTSTGASITFDDNRAGAVAGPSSYNPANGIISRSTVNVSTSWLASYGTTIDSYSYTTYVHEIGHALGLGHAGHYNGTATYGEDNHYRNDSTLVTAMSYFSPDENDFYGDFRGDPATPMPADVLAIWALYGRPAAVQGGDTVWGAGNTLGGTLGRLFEQIFDSVPADLAFYSGDPLFLAITDTGGQDILDLAPFAEAATVDLNPGGLSSSEGWEAVLATGPQTAIETVYTGAGDDSITGNAEMEVDHRLSSGAGDDTVIGGIGDDTVIGGEGNDSLLGGAAADNLWSDAVLLLHVPEISAQIYRLYEAVLNRAPDLAGHLAWTRAVALGELDTEAVAGSFIASREFQTIYGALDDAELVEQLYLNVLGRSASPAEIDAWLDVIADGSSRTQVVQGFSDSREFINDTAAATSAWTATRDAESWTDDLFRLYRATLARDPDIAGLQGWAETLAANPVLETVAAGFVGAREFQNVYGVLGDADFVSLLYQNVLGRAAATAEINAWLARIAGGDSRADVVLGFSQSLEFIASGAENLVAWVRSTGITGRLEGGGGDDVLAGGFGSDSFVFDLGDGAGTDRVLGFDPWDQIELLGFGYVTAEAALAHFSQVGSDVVFQDAGQRVVFEEVKLEFFDASTLSAWS
jgi:Ca2+-binding RTX toxin-like protein